MVFFTRRRNRKYLSCIDNKVKKFLHIENSPPPYKQHQGYDTIYLDLPIKNPNLYDYNCNAEFGFSLSYCAMTPSERYYYFSFLKNPLNFAGKNQMFLTCFYFSLERCMREGNFNEVYDMLCDLRMAYGNNKRFINESSKLILKYCIKYKHPEIISDFWDEVVGQNNAEIPFDLYLCAAAETKDFITSSDLITYRHQLLDNEVKLNFLDTPNTYEYNQFVSFMDNHVKKIFGTDFLEADVLIVERANVGVEQSPLYLNPCLTCENVNIPKISTSPMLRQAVQTIFDGAMLDYEMAELEYQKKKQESEEKAKTAGLKKGEKTYLHNGIQITEDEETFFRALLSEFNGVIDTSQITIDQGYLHLWFMHGINTLGGVKLRGRVFKIYNPRQQGQKISGLSEAIGFLPQWSDSVKKQMQEGIYNKYYEKK